MAEFGAPPQLTRDDLVEVLRRNMAGHWIDGLLLDPSSLSLFESTIAALLRAQDSADENLYVGAFILSAPGKAPATSTVRLTRPSGAAVTIDTTLRFQDDRGAVWQPVEDFDVPASGGAQTVDVPIRTVRSGYYLNSFEVLTFEALDDLPDPGFVIDPGVDVASGGTAPFLDQHGKERKVFRAPGESDQEYRNRIRFLEDQVSPKAIAQTVVEVLDAFPTTKFIADLIVRDGLRAVREPFQDGAQPAQVNLAGLPGPLFFDDVQPIPVAGPVPDPGASFFDDPSGGVIRDFEDYCAFFDVYLPTPVDPDEGRRFYDDSDPTFGSYLDDAFPDDAAGIALTAPIAALADELDRRRPHCVQFRIFVGEGAILLRHPVLTSLAQAGDWVDQGGSATDESITTALRSFDADGTYVVSALGTGAGAPLAAGDLLFTMPAVVPPLSVSRVIVRARVRQESVGAGVDPVLAFLVRPSTAVAAVRVASTFAVDFEEYREAVVILEENPVSAAAWTLADITGTFGVGVANAAAVGATEELRVSELLLEFDVDHG